MSGTTGNDDYDRLAQLWLEREAVSRGQMFGWVGLKVGRRFFALSIKDHLIVKLPWVEVEKLVGEGKASIFDPGWGRVKKSWADVDHGRLSTWPDLLQRSHDYVSSLD